ncbi:DUF262 domain-containing protein [Butyrivibrio sp. XBB1001]|uniref:DUF262 domain-containing protein n=1 Tax=Butyrivibrio sp. XBB1001 TaxID=1280682 RepID=UPI000423C52E|nr:DUF262 domain-containing protein [Butyrivibrio sp. XBB1001]
MTEANEIRRIKVGELVANKSMPEGMHFFIPNYQRGYRWKESQVQQLLNDIREFEYEKDNENKFYCLQPLVVMEDKDKGWIVIDGQQRLTTLFIILTCIEKMLYKEKANLYVMEYQNKAQMHDWLDSLGVVGSDIKLNEEDIDAYHITNAYLTVKKWLEETDDLLAVGAEIREKIRSYTRFIWYEVKGDFNPEIIFTNINMGKIKLTNAELIKALLLKKDNYKGENEEDIKSSQIRISTAWDNMESTLQKEDMWRFLTGSGKFSSIDTHIELIFQIMAREIIENRKEQNPEFYIENEEQLNKETYTFIVFSRELDYLKREYKQSEKEYSYSKLLEGFWRKIESFYNMFVDWYEEREWYHLIGALLSNEQNQSEEYFEGLCDLYRSHTKTEFVEELKQKIIDELDFEGEDKEDFEFNNEVVREYLNSLQYSGKKEEKDKIRNALLLFNVISMQQNNDSYPRFPFGAYQSQKWDIEHIHSVTTDRAQNRKEREAWLKEAKPYIDKAAGLPSDLSDEIEKIYNQQLYDDENATEYDDVYNRIIAFFSGESDAEDIPINEISNLTLLDQKTNRGYGNAIFPVKRNKILEKSGVESFIPLCTKNVFLKYYSKTVSQMYLWDKNDRQDYFDRMVQTISTYLSNSNDVDNEEEK